MRTVSINRMRHVAIMTQDAKPIREFLFLQPPGQASPADRFSVLVATAVNVIYHKKFQTRFPAARTVFPVMLNDRPSQLCQSFARKIKLPGSNYRVCPSFFGIPSVCRFFCGCVSTGDASISLPTLGMQCLAIATRQFQRTMAQQTIERLETVVTFGLIWAFEFLTRDIPVDRMTFHVGAKPRNSATGCPNMQAALASESV